MNKLIPTIVALALLLLSCATGDEKVSADASAPDTLSDLTSASDVSPDQEPVDTAQLELPEEFVEVAEEVDAETSDAMSSLCGASSLSEQAHRVTASANGTQYAQRANVVWNGEEFAVFHGAVQMRRFGPTLTELGSMVQVVTQGGLTDYLYSVDAVWTGQEYGLAWFRQVDGVQRVEFATVSTTGQLLSGPVEVGPAMGFRDLELVWTGSEYRVIWVQEGAEVEMWMGFFDGAGGELRPAASLQRGVAVDTDSLAAAWSGENIGLTWQVGSSLHFLEVDTDGLRLNAPMTLTTAALATSRPATTWTGSRYLTVWAGVAAAPGIFGVMADSSGKGTVFALTDRLADGDTPRDPELWWTGEELGIVWVGGLATAREVFFAFADATGAVLAGSTAISANPSTRELYYPVVSWTGTRYVAAWIQYEEAWGWFMKGFCP